MKRKRSAAVRPSMVREKLALAKQIRLVLADMLRAKPSGQRWKYFRKVFHRVDVGTCCALRGVATLEFIQHQLPKMVHGKPPVTRGLHCQQCPEKTHAAAPAAPTVLSSNADLISDDNLAFN